MFMEDHISWDENVFRMKIIENISFESRVFKRKKKSLNQGLKPRKTHLHALQSRFVRSWDKVDTIKQNIMSQELLNLKGREVVYEAIHRVICLKEHVWEVFYDVHIMFVYQNIFGKWEWKSICCCFRLGMGIGQTGLQGPTN